VHFVNHLQILKLTEHNQHRVKSKSFIKAKNKLVQQAQKALYSVYRKVRNLCIPVDLQLKLFDSIVLHILTYSCEVWGFC
jgi:hypothetical protein